MKDKRKEVYHVDADGNMVPFCSLLTCFEQNCYFEFRKVSKFNHWIYFCDDINMAVDDQGSIYSMRTAIHDRYQNVEEWIVEKNHFEEISELLRKKDTVMLTTAFNYVCNYAWWSEGKEDLHIGHMAYLIEEDSDYYYIVDSPDVFLNIEEIRLETNPSILKIPKENFAEAFQKYCRVYKINFHHLPSGKEEEFPFIQEVIRETVDHYFADEEDCFMGRKALEYLKEKCALHEEEVFKPCFMFHILTSRRILLKRALHFISSCNEHSDELTKHLNLSIEYWTKMKELAYAYVFNNKEVCETAGSVLSSLIGNEDRLMAYLRESFC